MTDAGGKDGGKCCCFLADKHTLQEKRCHMLRIGKMTQDRARAFERICGQIMSSHPDCTPSLAASLICVMTGVDRKTADNLFFEQLGLSLEDAIEALKSPIRHF